MFYLAVIGLMYNFKIFRPTDLHLYFHLGPGYPHDTAWDIRLCCPREGMRNTK